MRISLETPPGIMDISDIEINAKVFSQYCSNMAAGNLVLTRQMSILVNYGISMGLRHRNPIIY